MAITIQDPIKVVGTDPMLIGNAVPEGVIRNFKAVGINNPTGAAISCSVYLVPKGTNPDGTVNQVISRTILPNKTDMCCELLARGLNAGGRLFVLGAGLTVGYTSIDTVLG
jgi:hypothetical protein